jgi:hypothetical protein
VNDTERSLIKAHGMIASLAKELADHKAALAELHKRFADHAEKLDHHSDKHELAKREATGIHRRLGEHSARLGKLERARDGKAEPAPMRTLSDSQQRAVRKAFEANVRDGYL